MSISQINSASAYNNILATNNSYSSNTDNKTTTSIVPAQSSYSVASSISTISGFAEKYDVTNMSTDEMLEMSEALYDNGLISLRTSCHLNLRALADKTDYGNNPRNFVVEFQDSLKYKTISGASENEIEGTRVALSFLENMAALRESFESI